MSRFTEWEILLGWIPNTDGSPPPYKHRCVYLADSPQSKLPGGILVLGITSDVSAWKEGYSVDLPFLDAPGGHPETHLVKRSILQVHWNVHIMPDVISDVVGYVPSSLHAVIRTCLSRRISDIKNAIARRDSPS